MLTVVCMRVHCVNSSFLLQCEEDNRQRMKKLEKKKEERSKKARIDHKKRRSIEQSKRYVYDQNSVFYLFIEIMCSQEGMGEEAEDCS